VTISGTVPDVLDRPRGSQLQLERDLYRKCLDLARVEDPGPLLCDALDLLRELTGARVGYIELRDLSSSETRSWNAAAGVDDAARDVIVNRISQGVVAEAVETGEVVHIASALLDRRFRERESVQREALEAVLCVPVRAQSAVGVVYLQDHVEGGSFADSDVACVQAVAEFLGTLASRLLELQRRRDEQDRTAQVRARLSLKGLIGRSATLAELLERLEVLAAMEANVLITGPSGTGKSMFAALLHENSSRSSEPFIALNCAALPEGLVENELFGAERGAHSAAAQGPVAGKVSAAENGTLFLDEIGELPLSVQAKVLQLVQHREYFRLGGTKPIQANVRIITATNRDLEEEMSRRTFRADLYYRIRGVQLRVPSLVQRRGDIPLLVAHFCAESCLRNGLPNITPSASALVAAEFSDWPGNVREVASACEEAIVNARLDGSLEIELRHLFPNSNIDASPAFQQSRQRWERAFLQQTLASHEWNVAQTARVLEMSRSHLNALIRRYTLRRVPSNSDLL